MKLFRLAWHSCSVLFSVSAQAPEANRNTCHAAIQEDLCKPRIASPARSQCFRAAMQRCKAMGQTLF